MHRYIIMFFFALSFTDCIHQDNGSQQDRLKGLQNTDLAKLRAAHRERLNFLTKKSTLEGKKNDLKTQCFGEKCLTNLHDKSIPRTTYLADYNTMAMDNQPVLMSCFPAAFLPYVPQDILDALIKYKIPISNITLCWNIQFNGGFGTDKADVNTTRLKAHGWAAPNAPPDNQIKGDLVNRNFLMGVYDADNTSIANATVKINQLLPFPVHVHQTATGSAPISPPTMARIALTNDSPSQAFWSLVIDNNHLSGFPLRAGITLHWIFNSDDNHNIMSSMNAFYQMLNYKWNNKPLSFKQLVLDLKNDPIINNHKMMRSLRMLMSDIWTDII